MTKRYNFRPVPQDFADRFPDGDYTVGRAADPRGSVDPTMTEQIADAPKAPKSRKPSKTRKSKAKRVKKVARPAAA